jgi:hypothetical protein
VNEVNLTGTYAFTPRLGLLTSLNFVPRTGSDFALGDFFDLDLAQLEWVITDDGKTSLFVGKIDSAFGVEYRFRKAAQRFGITPSLIARYTTGTPLGLKARSTIFDGWLTFAAALTNGSSTIEMFEFYNETDTNNGKTVSGRGSLNIPLQLFSSLFTAPLEIGVSFEVGPQDRAYDSSDLLWFFGTDLLYEGAGFIVKGQWMRGFSPGRATDNVFALSLHGGGFLEVDWMVLGPFGVLGRAEYRDALVTLGMQRAYLTKSWRATVGARFEILPQIVLKAEYLRNGQYGEVPSIASDVFTSSLVMSF